MEFNLNNLKYTITINRDVEIIQRWKPLVDEFESALDEGSSKLIADKFLSSEKTVIMISHNLEQSFLQRFDSIIFMENGEVTAMEKYEVLLKKL